MPGQRLLHPREGGVQRLDLPDVRIHGRQRFRMLQLDLPDLVTDIRQRAGNPPGNQPGGKHCQHQRSQGNQQDRHDLVPDRSEQIRFPDAHHGVKLPPAGRHAAEQVPVPRSGETAREAKLLRTCESSPVLRVPGKNPFSFLVIKGYAFPESGPVRHHGGKDPADPLPDLNISAGNPEVVEVFHHQGDELLAVGICHVLGQFFVPAGKEKKLARLLPGKPVVPGFCFRVVCRDLVIQPGGNPDPVPGIQVDLVDRPVRENDQGKNHV